MKKIEATVRKEKFNQVKKALQESGVDYFTYHEVFGVGASNPKIETYRGASVVVDALPRIQMSLIVEDDLAHRAIDIILTNARTGVEGDGKVIVSDVEKIVSISESGKKNKKSLAFP